MSGPVRWTYPPEASSCTTSLALTNRRFQIGKRGACVAGDSREHAHLDPGRSPSPARPQHLGSLLHALRSVPGGADACGAALGTLRLVVLSVRSEGVTQRAAGVRLRRRDRRGDGHLCRQRRATRAGAIGVFGSTTGLSLVLGPIIGGALVDGLGWHSVFWVNVPIVAAAIVCTALFVPESRASRVRRFDPVGQTVVILVLGGVVFAITESKGLGRTSPVILGLLAVSVLGVLGILGYESRRVDPLLELRLFRSVPFSSAILMALFALCGFSAFLFMTTQYLQNVRGMSALTAGLCLLPVGALVVVLSPFTGRLVAARGPRMPLVVAGSALALGGGMSLRLAPATPLPAVLAIYLLFGIFLSTVNPPITNTAVSGMPCSMAGVATSLASAGRQTGTTLGVAISGTIVGSALTRGGTAFISAEHGVWWMVLGLGLGIAVLGLLSTGRWALGTAALTAALFEEVDRGTDRTAPVGRR
ncbi:MFS transporter [Streptomyces sp. NPDC087845]|uniref:MFS transporter n=1 Tax=Streptomyces sp. NPDC087845 TaxID=3365806 RepID=UPI00380E7AC5